MKQNEIYHSQSFGWLVIVQKAKFIILFMLLIVSQMLILVLLFML